MRTCRVLLLTTAVMAAITGDIRAADAPDHTTAATAQRGEPYDLGGRRLAFTTWQYVRPGLFAWVDAQGNGVSVVGGQGPDEARFKRADHPHGIRLVAQPARREGVIWSREVPAGTAGGIAIITLIHDQGTYKAWGIDQGQEKRTVYFESKDGRAWSRPAVQFEADGKPAGGMNLGEGTIFIDPSAPPSERYKCVTLDSFSYDDFEAFKKRFPDRWEPLAKREDVGSVFYIRGFVSADGFSWRSLPDPLSVEHSDTQIVACYDAALRTYVIYTRKWMVEPRSPTTQAVGQAFHVVGRRSIGRTESGDFRRFPLSQLVMVPSPDMPPSDVLYTNCRTSLPGAPFSHLMFPAVWRLGDDSTSIFAASSPDGRVWDFLPHREVFQTASFGEWDGGCVFARPNLVELPDGTFVLPYTGYNVPHKYPRGQFRFSTGYMAWPKGRLIALQADGSGEFSTVAFIAPGRKLLVNADVLRAGGLTIEVADIYGAALSGRTFSDSDPMFGDVYKKPATWRGRADLGANEGAPIILRFRLDRAKLFNVDFE